MAKKKTTTRKTTSRKTSARKTSASKSGGSKASSRKTSGSKSSARKTSSGKPNGRKTAGGKASGPARKTSGSRSSAAGATSRATPARKVAPTTRSGSPKTATSNARAARASVADKPAKSPYNKTQLKAMREALLVRRERVARDLNLMGDEALREGDHEIDAESVADHGTDAYERNLTLGLMEADSRTLRQIDTALLAMDDGSYGLCQECSEAIPLARLEALPFATTCVPCQERAEGGR